MSNWEPTGYGLQIFNDRYARYEGETWDEASNRVSSHVAQVESNGNVLKWSERFNNELHSGRFMPGGRIWYGAGRPKAQLLNCFVVPTSDSREGWGKTSHDVIVISGLMGGVGINFSPVRPRGSEIKGTGGVATGAVSLMELINGVGNVIVGGGGRRMALMMCLDINHPDLMEFIDKKLNRKVLNNGNVSVIINMPTEEFVEKIRNNEDITFKFNGKETGKKQNARALWKRIVHNAWKSGEPGVLNGYEANRLNNIYYYRPLISTNPCGEIWLEEYGCCDLGALVLPRFVSSGSFDWDAFDSSIRSAVRFLDNVLSVNHYPLPEIKENCENVRRIGLGVMGLHNMLLDLGMKYTDENARAFTDHLFSVLKNTAYDASINLAIEKGPFPAYDERFLESGFTKTLKRGIRNKIREHGIRNCATLTIAPTGTTSIVQGVSSGIEPIYAPVHYRNYWQPTSDGSKINKKELVVDPYFDKYPELCQGALDIHPRDHFEMQKIVQQHIDNAVSKSINLREDFPEKELADLWLEYLPYIKGATLYRSGSRGQEPLEYVSPERYKEIVSQEKVIVEQVIEDCPSGVCEMPYTNSNVSKELELVHA